MTDWGGGVSAAAPRVHLVISTDNGRLHNALLVVLAYAISAAT